MLSLTAAIHVTRDYHQKKRLMGKKTLPCHYCGKRAGWTVDHIVPKAMGGPNAPWNTIEACQPCNNKKADKWPTCECWRCERARREFKALKRAGMLKIKSKGKIKSVPASGISSHKKDACSGLPVDESATVVP